MPMTQHRTVDSGILVTEKAVERGDGGQAAIDGAGLQTAFSLKSDEVVDVVKRDCGRVAVANELSEFGQVIAVALGGVGAGIAAAQMIDKAVLSCAKIVK